MGFQEILRHALSERVHFAEIELRHDGATVSGFPEPRDGFRIVLGTPCPLRDARPRLNCA